MTPQQLASLIAQRLMETNTATEYEGVIHDELKKHMEVIEKTVLVNSLMLEKSQGFTSAAHRSCYGDVVNRLRPFFRELVVKKGPQTAVKVSITVIRNHE